MIIITIKICLKFSVSNPFFSVFVELDVVKYIDTFMEPASTGLTSHQHLMPSVLLVYNNKEVIVKKVWAVHRAPKSTLDGLSFADFFINNNSQGRKYLLAVIQLL